MAIGDTPVAAAVHAPSQTVLLLTRGVDSLCWLRLLHAATLQEVTPPYHSLTIQLYVCFRSEEHVIKAWTL